MRLHPEKIPSAIERYQKEILRVFRVLDSVLAKQEWLVGGKPTIADLSFVAYVHAFNYPGEVTTHSEPSWDQFVTSLNVIDFDFDKEYPAVAA